MYFSFPAVSHNCALTYPPSRNCIIFVANSIAIVGNGDVGNTPFTYFANKLLFPTEISPTRITFIVVNFAFISYLCKDDRISFQNCSHLLDYPFFIFL